MTTSQQAEWVRDHSVRLRTLDPDDPLDDLEPLRALVGSARVVAVGENAHFIREFTLVRERLLRFLVERCGYGFLAYEFSFAEGFALDRWLQPAGSDLTLAQVSATASAWGASGLMQFVRRLNQTVIPPVRFSGIDIPEAGGSLLPALSVVADYLREADPPAVPLLEAALEIAKRFAGKSAVTAARGWASLAVHEQDALTAALARLLFRVRALEPVFRSVNDHHRYDMARRALEAAACADDMLRAMTSLLAGTTQPGDLSSRDQYMAESVRWHLDRAEPGTRVVLLAHNNHIQKTPVRFGGQLTTVPMGQYLQQMLGDDYVALALSSAADQTAEMYLDETAPVGFTVKRTPLGAPEPGSVEAAVKDAGLDQHATLIDFRGLRHPSVDVRFERIRTQSTNMLTEVPAAFDGVLVVPTVTIDDQAEILGPSRN
jgi:erythromycin esterase